MGANGWTSGRAGRVVALCAAALAFTGLIAVVAQARTRLTVHVSPTHATAGTKVKIVIRGTDRTKCSLTVRADRKGSHPSLRKRVKLRSSLQLAVSSPAGVRIIGIKCGSRRAQVRLTVVARPAAAVPTATPVPSDEGAL